MKKNHSLFFLFFLIILSCNKDKTPSLGDKLYNRASDLYYEKKYDSAFVKFYKAHQDYLDHKDNENAAKAMIFLSIIQNEKGDYLGSNESATKAAKLLKKDDENFVSIYNQFGRNHDELKNYKEAIYFYNKAIPYSNDEHSILVLKNNIGIINLKLKNYNEAVKIFENASKSNCVKDSIDLGNKILDNYAYSKFLLNANYNAENELTSILANKFKRKDLQGVNASLAHLSDYFSKRDQKKSLDYAKAMYENSKRTGSPEDQLDALRKIIRVETINLKPLFEKYQNLNDSIQNVINNSKSQFTSVIYDAEQSRAEVLSSKNEIQRQYFLLGILILLITITTIEYRRRQKKLQQEKEIEVKNTQLKMSKKVHDVVANGIYQVMTKIENQEDFDRDKALDELEFVYEKSRDISYDKIGEEKEFSKVISELIASFNNDTVKTFTAGNSPAIWESVSPTVKEEVYQMVRELMVNMKKHSQASHVAVKFEKINNVVEIQYKDNGIGIPGDLVYKNGLRNAASRIEAINGTLTFETKIEKGLKVNLSFPVS
ncbi:ATP-binding protein [Chryseobacterium sp.]|uniref:tetratricopeptide repeat-containing sensor histidine kinase n=1 Tax=Chryseobacterium sp. TaxID=1871047 RepID=UPI0031D71660